MTRPTLILLFAIAYSPAVFGQEAKASPAVKRILDKATNEVKKNRQEFDNANRKPLGDARVELKEWSTKLIQDGKVVDAAAVLKQIENLEADVMKMANAPAPIDGGTRIQPQRPLMASLVGKWTHPNSDLIYYFTPDGLFHEDWKRDGRVNSQGQVVLLSPDVAEVKLTNNHKIQVRLAGSDMLAVLVWDPAGKPAMQGIVLERVR